MPRQGGRHNRRRGFGYRERRPRDDSPDDDGGYYNFSWLFQPRRRWEFPRRPNCFNYGHGCGYHRYPGEDQDQDQDQAQPKPEHKDVLQVEKVDFQVAQNTKQHHTDEYDITSTERPDPQLVVRRGQQFTIRIEFNRPYDVKKDDLRLVFEIGDQPKPSKGTQVEFVLSDKDEENKWGAKIAKQEGKALLVNLFTPPACIVGKWRFKVSVVKKAATAGDQTAVFTYNHDKPIYMLFNPWLRADTVYMEKEDDRYAYVLKEEGKIYCGSCKKISARPWVFGQFKDTVLDCCMYLLEKSGMNYSARGNPILVTRKLSSMVNSFDNSGVLAGNWSGDYSGGKSPLTWTGSAPILEQYYETRRPVRFGQCWVFSGVMTAVARSLGIPARSVTNFASAHDVDTSVSIDYHYDCDGNPMEDHNEDSVWNFHVWNELWMARPDLPPGYGGWQAADATPQEASDGVYCCGPCPLRAIKEGDVNLLYDGPFIFAEVNADKVYWVQQEDGSWKNVHKEKSSIGQYISTLSKNTSQADPREDVTCLYKYPEGSAEERVAVRKANMTGSTRDDVYEESVKDVEFELCFDSDTFVGNQFELQLRCKNNSKQTRTIQGQCSTSTMYYTGVVASLVAKEKINSLQLKPGEVKTMGMVVKPDDYLKVMKDCCMLSLSAMAKVKETQQIFTKKDDTRLRKPHLNIKAPASAKKGVEMDVEVSFTNPMQKTLTDCYMEVEGPGLGNPQRYNVGDVAGNGTFFHSLKLKPKKKGKKEIVVIFNSKELEDINGSHEVTVQE